jgi:hypothetical protein
MATSSVFLIQLKLFVQMHPLSSIRNFWSRIYLSSTLITQHTIYSPTISLSPLQITLHKQHPRPSGLEETLGGHLRTQSLTPTILGGGGGFAQFFNFGPHPWPWPLINVGLTPKKGLTYQPPKYSLDLFLRCLLHGTTPFVVKQFYSGSRLSP